jgi:hypothetical protein
LRQTERGSDKLFWLGSEGFGECHWECAEQFGQRLDEWQRRQVTGRGELFHCQRLPLERV